MKLFNHPEGRPLGVAFFHSNEETMKTKQKTNVQFIRHLMETSRHGALMQAFVLEAIERYAMLCSKAGAEAFDSSLLSGAAWHGCAVEVAEGLRQHYGRPDPNSADS